MTDPHWLVKDFHVLYRSAQGALDAIHQLHDEPTAEEKRALDRALDGLNTQIERLKPAFETCEAERKSASPAAVRVLRDAGYPKTAAVAEAQRLTPAERQALGALHRWLHSPLGDDALIEEAQAYHEQIETEPDAECERLNTEERDAYDAIMREDAIELARRGET